MGNFRERFSELIYSIRSSKSFSLAVILVLAAAIPLTVFIAQKQQDIRQRAESIFPQKSQDKKPGYIPSEIIVKFRKEAISGKNAPQNAGILDKTAVAPGEVFAKDSQVASLFSEVKVEKIEKVYKGVGTPEEEIKKLRQKGASLQGANLDALSKIDLSRTYKLNLSEKDPIKLRKIIIQIIQSGLVEYAESNFLFKTSQTDSLPPGIEGGGGPTPTPTPSPTPTGYPNDPYYLDSYPSNIGNRDLGWNPNYDYQWNLKKINVEGAWNISKGNPEIKVAVVDTGIDYTHGEFGSCTLEQVNTNQCAKVAPGVNVISNNFDPRDEIGHGTHVSGIIGAITNNALGIASIAPNVRIMPIKVFDADGNATLESVSQGIQFGAFGGARVINLSLGTNEPIPAIPSTLKEALDYAAGLNVVLVAAAGNDNKDVNDGYWPAAYPRVMSVSATDQNDQKANYSNYGKIEVAAPGGDESNNLLSLRMGGGFLRASGTSMASPHVAALAALILSTDSALSSLAVRSRIESTADDLGEAGYDRNFGWGRVNAGRALLTSGTSPVARIVSPLPNERVSGIYSILGIAWAQDFQNYRIQVGEGKSPTSWSSSGISLTNNGLQKVEYGLLGTLDTNSYKGKDLTLKLEVFTSSGETRESLVSFTVPLGIPITEREEINENPELLTYAYGSAGVSDRMNYLFTSWHAVRNGSSDGRNEIYFSKSQQTGGISGPNKQISLERSGTYSFYPAWTIIGNDIFLAFENYATSPKLSSKVAGKIILKKSTDQGISFSTEKSIEVPGMSEVTSSNFFEPMEVRMTTDSNRYLYLTWEAGNLSDMDDYIYFSRFDTQTDRFEQTKVIRRIPNSYEANPSIVVDKAGNVYVVWSERSSELGGLRVTLTKSVDLGEHFSDPVILFSEDNLFYQNDPMLALDKTGHILYLTFMATDPVARTPEIFFVRSTDKGETFSNPRNLSNGRWSSFIGAAYGARVVVDGQGRVFVSWVDWEKGKVFLALSEDFGQTFSKEIEFQDGDGSSGMSNGLSMASFEGANIFITNDMSEYTGPNSPLIFKIWGRRTDFPIPAQTLTLAQGWNLVGVSVDRTPNYKAKDFLRELNIGFTPGSKPNQQAPVGDKVLTITQFDRSRGRNITYSPSNVNSNFSVNPEEGFFVRSAWPGTVVLPGTTSVLSSMTIAKGHSIISFPTVPTGLANAENVLQAMKQQGVDVRQITRWYGGRFVPHDIGSGANNFSIIPGEGYFIRNFGEAKTFSLP